MDYHVGTMWAVADPERAIRAYKRSIELGRSGTNDATLAAVRGVPHVRSATLVSL